MPGTVTADCDPVHPARDTVPPSRDVIVNLSPFLEKEPPSFTKRLSTPFSPMHSTGLVSSIISMPSSRVCRISSSRAGASATVRR